MEPLTAEQVRVLGALVEKGATTPDQYPLTMNALLAACNQASNRNPVVSYDSSVVDEVLVELRQAGLARVVHSPSNRAERYRHVLDEKLAITTGETAVLAVLMLRGPQTVNDLRARTERYPGLEEMGGVEGVLHRLKNRYEQPFVTRLERQPGQREERWAHLLAGEVLSVPEPAPASSRSAGGSERIAALEALVTELAGQVGVLRRDLDELKALLD